MDGSDTIIDVTPEEQAKDLPRVLIETERRIKTSALAHWRSTNTLENYARWFTCLTIAGGFVVSILGAVPIVTPDIYRTYASAINLSLFVFASTTSILSIFQTIFRWSERAQAHRIAASQYTNARCKLEVLLIRLPYDLEALEDLLHDLTHLSDTTPSVPTNLWTKAVKEIKRQSAAG